MKTTGDVTKKGNPVDKDGSGDIMADETLVAVVADELLLWQTRPQLLLWQTKPL